MEAFQTNTEDDFDSPCFLPIGTPAHDKISCLNSDMQTKSDDNKINIETLVRTKTIDPPIQKKIEHPTYRNKITFPSYNKEYDQTQSVRDIEEENQNVEGDMGRKNLDAMNAEDDFDSPRFSPIGSLLDDVNNDPISKTHVKSRIHKIKIGALTRTESFVSPILKKEFEVSTYKKEIEVPCHNEANETVQSDDDIEENGNMLEDTRRKNLEAMNTLLNSLRNPELEKQFVNIQSKSSVAKVKSSSKPKKRRGDGDSLFRFTGLIPLTQRKSSRLQNKDPEYKENYLDYVHETLRATYLKKSICYSDDFLDDLEEVVYKPKRNSTVRRKLEEHVIISVEEVTQAMLDNIAVRVKSKKHSQDGTTCHQCRQKTLDQKTCCRNPKCSGIQGMFCGVCIKNRYGEDAAEALKNPNWRCPVCRKICNCSICRTKQGKRPTGILAPLCHQQGYESVDHFLVQLRGEGDRPEEDDKWESERENEALLGFSDSGRKMYFKDGSSYDILTCFVCSYGNSLD